MRYSVVIPAHNEMENLEKLVPFIWSVLKGVSNSFEIIVVDDNSTDDTENALNSMKRKYPELKPIYRKSDKGVGNTIRRGFKEASGDYIITLDGDLSHDPKEIPKFIAAIEDCDLVCGSRYVKGGKAEITMVRSLISKTFNLIFRLVLGVPIRDFTSGYRILRKHVVKSMDLKSHHFGIYIEIPIKANKMSFRLKEIPVHYHPRFKGVSKLRYIKQGPEYLKVIIDNLL